MASKVLWYQRPEESLADLPTFLAHAMVTVRRRICASLSNSSQKKKFRKALVNARAGLFAKDSWRLTDETPGSFRPGSIRFGNATFQRP